MTKREGGRDGSGHLGRIAVGVAFLLGCAGSPATETAPATPPAPVAAPTAPAPGAPAPELRELAERAVGEDTAVAQAAIARLRAAGPAGLDALFWTHSTVLNASRSAPPRIGSAAASARTRTDARVFAAVDGVARQRDAWASRLYWYTDLEQAKAEALRSGRPILSLRLLGSLDEELSCANSRFFRTALYPDEAVSRRLRDAVVLHWSSERPAPRITIDFGDGRRLERTITGNSIHYVLDAEGRPIDALPGLYGPQAFLRGLDAAVALHASEPSLGAEATRAVRRAYHASQRDLLAQRWNDELTALGFAPAPPPPVLLAGGPAPRASKAAPVAMSKAMVEAPVVRAIQGPVQPLPVPVSESAWAALLARHAGDARLDAASRAVVRSKMGDVDDAAFERRVAAFERAMNEDTLRNEFTLHRTLHEWLAMSPAPEDMATLNARVYASLFLTPRSDPWLGLLDEDAYSAIDRDGVVRDAQR